jgi:hypothetical protein
MGIDISGLGKVRRIRNGHSDELCDTDFHYYVGDEASLLDGLRPGCYVNEGRVFYFYVTYVTFSEWQDALSQVLFGLPAIDVAENRDLFEGEPLLDLVDFPFSNDVGVGPSSSARLYDEMARYSRKVKLGFQRLASEAARQRRRAKRARRGHEELAQTSKKIAKQLGATLAAASGDAKFASWEWKWQLYRNFRRAFKVASGEGLVLVSI